MTTGRDEIQGTDSVQTALKTKVNDDMTELFAIKAEVEAARDGLGSLLAQIDSLQELILGLTPTGGMCSAAPWASRPAFGAINNGHLFVATDQGNLYIADKEGLLGTAERWVVRSGNRYAAANLPTTGSTFTVPAGTIVYDTTNKQLLYCEDSLTTTWMTLDAIPETLLLGGL